MRSKSMNDMADKQAKPALGTADIVKVMQLLPHRYPSIAFSTWTATRAALA
jgi:hypothetical protein